MTVDPPNASAGRIACAQCRRDIDTAARLCPYCGADPRTGMKPVDTQAMLDTMFHPRETTASESVVDFARRRQGVVIALGVLLGFLLLAGLHEYVTRRNARLVSSAAAIPLTEVADLSDQPDETRPLPLPKLELQFDGHPQVMRTFVVEPNAVTPPDVLAAQAAATAKPATTTVGPPAPAKPTKH
ncbi:MAG TPA: zinc ribbon domain-containing protein [Thermoanaerobaculia bacterium]|jgi:hypothetical protein|nr:zinc ribbon domain-containing protein [Thermoanaerobaculia bacterium]